MLLCIFESVMFDIQAPVVRVKAASLIAYPVNTSLPCLINLFYYVEKGVLLGILLVESIFDYIREPSGVFLVCNARE